MKSYDCIVIGAGSVGLPVAWALAEKKLEVMVVEKNPSPGQGQNKAAIGGIRATHSDPAKIQTCRESLRIFSTWKEAYGDDIGWVMGGYSFPAYTAEIEKTLKELLVVQHRHGLNISWLTAKEILTVIPGLNPRELRGGTYSPEDGNVSPLLAAHAFYRRGKELGVEFRFRERVTAISVEKGGAKRVTTDKGTYHCEHLVLAPGAEAREVGKLLGLDLPVFPDSHEGGITEPVAPFFAPMVVDLRRRPGTKNFYFYQNFEGQVVFCVTPEPIIEGTGRNATSGFLPQVARRLIEVMPRLRSIKVRRTWRGLYPMTPDGVPLVDRVQGLGGVYIAAGLCGQGLMLGPGIALNLTSLITRGSPLLPEEVFALFGSCRDFACVELLK